MRRSDNESSIREESVETGPEESSLVEGVLGQRRELSEETTGHPVSGQILSLGVTLQGKMVRGVRGTIWKKYGIVVVPVGVG